MPEENPYRKRSMMPLIGGALVLVLVIGGYYLWTRSAAPAAPTPEPEATPEVTTATYASSTMGISITYPKDFTVNDAYQYTQVNPKKPISGVQFIVPLVMATGTNLASDSYLAIEQLPRAKICTGDIYLAANVKPVDVTEGGATYSVATSSGAAAGNRYEEMVFAIASSSPCTAVRYFIHSGSTANYPAGEVREFDGQALIAAFDVIRRSLTFVR